MKSDLLIISGDYLMTTLRNFLFLLIFFSLTTPLHAAPYEIDSSHSKVGFQVKHLGISNVTGAFKEFKGKLNFDSKNIAASSVETEIVIKSVDTLNKKRDDHLLNKDFFNEPKFPLMTFKSKAIKNVSGNKFDVVGDLTLHGVTKEVTLKSNLIGEVKDPWGKEKAGFYGEVTIDRRDFGLKYNKLLETGGLVISHDVKIMLDIEANKIVEEKPAEKATKK